MFRFFQVTASPLGPIKLTECHGKLCSVDLDVEATSMQDTEDPAVERSTPLLEQVQRQLAEYFDGQRQTFDIPLSPEGTAFQKKAWQSLQAIPYGTTWSYGQQARHMGHPTAVRAVGGANGRNPIPIIIPCHRVIGSNGSLTGYSGGMSIKQFLLALESAHPVVNHRTTY